MRKLPPTTARGPSASAVAAILFAASKVFPLTSGLLHHQPGRVASISSAAFVVPVRDKTRQHHFAPRFFPHHLTMSRSRSAQPSGEGVAASTPHAPSEILPKWFNQERSRVLTKTVHNLRSVADCGSDSLKCCVLYWMQRDMRTSDNWAILLAQHLAIRSGVPLRVVYAMPPPYQATPPPRPDDDGNTSLPRMTYRHSSFLLGGLKCVSAELQETDVPFEVLFPDVEDDSMSSSAGRDVHEHAMKCKALAVVTDFSPLRHVRDATERGAAPLLERDGVPLYQVDAHNIVPVWHATNKREVGARTLRPKINKLLPAFMTHFPKFEGNTHLGGAHEDDGDVAATAGGNNAGKTKQCEGGGSISWKECESYLDPDHEVAPVTWAKPGTEAGMANFDKFCRVGLKHFADLRNNPNERNVTSHMSPWTNYGQVSFQRLALEVRALKRHNNGTASFIEEGVVRKELSDNYCFYSEDTYDSLDAAAGWARESLELHEGDEREYLYTLEEFEQGRTHDDLWNAAQIQVVEEGKMHGFLRMYWAKKILEWTPSASVALQTGLYLNDRYALDGSDPNGFVGVGWSVMGIHDMGWKERPIFGKIRYMNYAGCKRKFKVNDFVAKYPEAGPNADKASKKHNPNESVSGKKRKATK